MNEKNDKIKIPSYYQVILFDDAFTPFNYVSLLLIKIFNKSDDEAKTITEKIHEYGFFVVGTYIQEIAITKKKITDNNSKKNGYPLLCEIEKI